MKPWQHILSHYHKTKRASPFLLNSTILPPTFKALSLLNHPPKHGMSLHADAIKLGLLTTSSSSSSSNSIITFYMKSAMPDSASKLFDEMSVRNSVSWNALIHGFLALGHHNPALEYFLQARINYHGFEPNVSTLVLLLHSCWKLQAFHQGRNIHGFLLKTGFSDHASIRNSLLSFYVKSRDMDSAKALFDGMRDRDVVAHSVLISGYALSRDPGSAVRVFRSIRGSDVDGLVMVGVLQACAAAAAGGVGLGRTVHSHVVRRGFEADLFVGNLVVDMYFKCRDVDSAIRAFDSMPGTNVVSWNCMLSGLVRSEMYSEALELFGSMSEVGVEGDEVTVVNLLQASKKLGMGVWCKCIHSVAIRRSFETNEFVLNSLLDAYAKCDLLDLASRLFERLDRRDVISWSTMIAGFAHCGKPDEAIALFLEMRLAKETPPNAVTMLSLLEACAVSAELRLSKSAHGLAIRSRFADELAVGTALVDVYAKCGDVASSARAFRAMPERNVLSWNAMIGGLGMNGRTREAMDALREMELRRDVRPNGVTMLSVLSACSHGGLVEEGLSCFGRMKEDPLLEPGPEHYSCVVDMLGRAGELERALEVIEGMPGGGLGAGKAAWSALLSACRSHGDLELGQVAASRVIELEPTNSAGYLLSSSMYAKGGLREKVAGMRRSMRESTSRLESGCSVVHVEERAHKFYSWDGSHPRCEQIYDMVEHIHDTLSGRECLNHFWLQKEVNEDANIHCLGELVSANIKNERKKLTSNPDKIYCDLT